MLLGSWCLWKLLWGFTQLHHLTHWCTTSLLSSWVCSPWVGPHGLPMSSASLVPSYPSWQLPTISPDPLLGHWPTSLPSDNSYWLLGFVPHAQCGCNMGPLLPRGYWSYSPVPTSGHWFLVLLPSTGSQLIHFLRGNGCLHSLGQPWRFNLCGGRKHSHHSLAPPGGTSGGVLGVTSSSWAHFFIFFFVTMGFVVKIISVLWGDGLFLQVWSVFPPLLPRPLPTAVIPPAHLVP